MASALANYYQAMADEKQASIPGIQAQARLTSLNADALPANADADRFAKLANANTALAQAGLITANAAQVAPNAAADRQRTAATTDLTNTQALASRQTTPGEIALRAAQTAGLNLTNSTILPSFDSTLASQAQQRALSGLGFSPIQGFAHGTSKVTAGKRSKPKAGDHIPALLADGEAVLNRGAAEHMGRGVISHLNKLGMMRMAAQHEVSKHAAKLATHAAKGGKPAKGGIMHFLAGTDDVHAAPGMVAAMPNLLAMLAQAQPVAGGNQAGAGGGGSGAAAPAAGGASAPAPKKAPAPKRRRK